VAVKAVAALHATHNARAYNASVQAAAQKRSVWIAPARNGLALALRF
jgi:ligand-binding sensor domain-containing protein